MTDLQLVEAGVLALWLALALAIVNYGTKQQIRKGKNND